jgi:uncharacterized protein (TIGR01777 family)
MRIIITGATGLIGKALCAELHTNYEIVSLTRNPQNALSSLGPDVKIIQWNGRSNGQWTQCIDGAFAVINLAGENVASARWTSAKKQRILESRLNASSAIVDAIVSAKSKPNVLIQSSAVGYYGFNHQESLNETSPAGEGFLADVCRQWELQIKPAETAGTRCVIIRSGMVLSSQGGALPRIVRPFKFFLGGCPSSGRQWVSWITIDDEINAIKFLIENPGLCGVFNLTTPNPVRMKDLCEQIGRILKKPCLLPIPALALRLVFGKMADEILIADQRVIPARLIEAGFNFAFPDIADALEYVIKKRV